jgi:hypothetical protein
VWKKSEEVLETPLKDQQDHMMATPVRGSKFRFVHGTLTNKTEEQSHNVGVA